MEKFYFEQNSLTKGLKKQFKLKMLFFFFQNGKFMLDSNSEILFLVFKPDLQRYKCSALKTGFNFFPVCFSHVNHLSYNTNETKSIF